MAVASSSPSKRDIADQKKKKKISSSKKEAKSHKQSDNGCPSPAKRTKCPGVRLINGRIYDSEKGKTCHQCRQKTMDFTAACKNKNLIKPCSLQFCHTCLLNRYGEKAEEVEALDDWNCPRCRGICNCSFCRKKRGHQPTGALVQTAKATGFSSVSELLHVKGPENFGHNKIVEDIGASPKKVTASKKEAMIASPRKLGKENSFDGKIDGNVDNGALSVEISPHPDEKKPKKMKQERLKEMHDGRKDNGALLKETSRRPDEKKTKKMKREELKEMHDCDGGSAVLKEASNKKSRISNKIYNKEVKINAMVDGVLQEEDDSKIRVSKKVSLEPFRNKKINEDGDNTTHHDAIVLDCMKNQNGEAHNKAIVGSCKVKWNALDFQKKDLDADPLPQGTELTTVAGTDLSPEDVGNALQFLEFCATFGKILNVAKGQPESVLRELIHGRSRSRGKYSTVVQFHIQLLSVILKESGEVSPTLSPDGKNSWFHALKNCISESQCVMDSLSADFLRRAGGYESLDSSIRLNILNFLCDEVLGTVKIRNWIDDQNLKFAERGKEAKEGLLAAKEKEKRLKQKMLDELAAAIIAKNGAPLSISEHEAIVSQIKSEAAQAHAEMLESKGMVPDKKQQSDAVRTVPIFVDINGCAYWRLKSYFNKADILRQDIGTGYAVSSGEKWFAYDVEQKKVIEKHISLRETRLRTRKVTEMASSKSSASNL